MHLMADTESLGESGVEWLESIARLPEAERRVRVPTVTDPRGIDFCTYRKLKQEERMAGPRAGARSPRSSRWAS